MLRRVRGYDSQAADGYAFTPVGAQRLKGFDEPVELFRLERAL